MFRRSAEHIDKVADEWALNNIEKVPESVVTAAKDKSVSVDHYWREMLSITTVEEPKYPFLSVLVKTALVLPHSNTDVERCLSVNNRMVTMDKTQLSKTAINGLRSAQAYVKFSDLAGMHPKKICVNKNLLLSARKAYSLYNARIEEEKREKAEKLKKEHAVLDEKLKAERLLNAKKMATTCFILHYITITAGVFAD